MRSLGGWGSQGDRWGGQEQEALAVWGTWWRELREGGGRAQWASWGPGLRLLPPPLPLPCPSLGPPPPLLSAVSPVTGGSKLTEQPHPG